MDWTRRTRRGGRGVAGKAVLVAAMVSLAGSGAIRAAGEAPAVAEATATGESGSAVPSSPGTASAPSASPPARAVRPKPEFRGVWVTRFEWPDRNGDAGKMKARISEIMRTIAANNFNAVLFQVRGQADVLYPSPFEPWSPLIGGRDPGFDPLAFAIEEAHKNGLEFHAYINAFTCWNGRTAPSDPRHAFNIHQDWLCRNEKGDIVRTEYTYFSPGIPQVQSYLRAVILDVVQRYDVDGIHLDRIRYPAQDVSHDPVSEARFKGLGNPGRLSWEDWQRAQIDGFLNDLYGQILAMKPRVKLTSSVWGIYDRTKIPGYEHFSTGYQQYYQDSLMWLRLGAMDALVPMIYWDMGGKKPDYDECYRFFMANTSGRHIYGGFQTKYRDKEEPMREIEYTRSVGGAGTVGFSYSGIDHRGSWSRYEAVYPTKVRTPGMAWKSDPTTGNILGLVEDGSGRPVVDAWVRVGGLPSVWLTSGDGLFSILNQTPSLDITVTVESPGFAPATVRGLRVASATTTPLRIRLERATAPPVAGEGAASPVAEGEATQREAAGSAAPNGAGVGDAGSRYVEKGGVSGNKTVH